MSDTLKGFLSSLNYPPLVAAVGATILLCLLFFQNSIGSSSSLTLLKVANILAFVINIVAVSIPGRIDGQPQVKSISTERSKSYALLGEEKDGKNNYSANDTVEDEDTTFNDTYNNGRSLVMPAPWAFAIWGVIYLGEFVFCTAGLFTVEKTQLVSALEKTTVPFVVANLMQSLWCASFRPSYNQGWHKYISAFMLAGTAYALSQVSIAVSLLAIATIGQKLTLYYIPMTIHFGWTTAATLVNLNGSLAMTDTIPDSTIIVVGHASAVAGAALGVSITSINPFYGLTLAWALAACGNGMKERADDTTIMKHARVRQRIICYIASALCIVAAVH